MAGAAGVQLVSALLRNGPAYLARVKCGVEQWAEEHGFRSLDELRGIVKFAASADPSRFERDGYVRTLQGGSAFGASSNT
jgi:dihydroorotate dehydrogenase (fumarate)